MSIRYHDSGSYIFSFDHYSTEGDVEAWWGSSTLARKESAGRKQGKERLIFCIGGNFWDNLKSRNQVLQYCAHRVDNCKRLGHFYVKLNWTIKESESGHNIYHHYPSSYQVSGKTTCSNDRYWRTFGKAREQCVLRFSCFEASGKSRFETHIFPSLEVY